MARKKKNKHKRPRAEFDPLSRKLPRAEPGLDSMSLNPSWRLSLVELVEPFGWHGLDLDMAERIRKRLAAFESMTWSEILVRGKKRHHSIPVSEIVRQAQKRLTVLGQQDVESLVSLSLGGKERIWGILELGVLKILWWDPKHLICPSKLKHT